MKIMIISGYFNPLHVGHLTYCERGAELADKLVVIVNNDQQQMLKKGQIINKQADRMRLVKALQVVDDVVLSIDTELPVINTLEKVAKMYPDDELTFGNGGDRSGAKLVPETTVCEKYGIGMVFDLGVEKEDSSSRINQDLGIETS